MSNNSEVQHLFLTGYMGSGKSTVGKLLSERLQLPFYDLDSEIEKEVGLSISEIFKNRGEAYFRSIEEEVLKTLIKINKTFVIALGGGALMNKAIVSYCKSNGILVYLKANTDTIIKRIKASKNTRPLLLNLKNDGELTLFVQSHLAERKPFYKKAHLSINVDESTPEQIVHELIKTYTLN
jgi:shikimate kinase